MMKIALFGDVSDRAAIKAAIKEVQTDLDIEIVDIDIFKDEEIIIMCGHPLENVGVEIPCYAGEKLYQDNSFRGGARGRKGKIKYRRG